MTNVIYVDASFKNEGAVNYLVNYVSRCNYAAGYGVTNMAKAAEQMNMVKEVYDKNNKRLMLHFIISLDTRESNCMTDDELFAVGADIAYIIAQRNQVVFGVHDDTNCKHLHFGVNTVSYIDGLKITNEISYMGNIINRADELFEPYGFNKTTLKMKKSDYED